jgi:CDP-diacylglycerol--serine O-phosphatidyltransferase
LYAIIFLLSYLMVSNLPLLSLKFKDFSIKNNLPKFIMLAVAVGTAIFLRWFAVPVVFIFYIVLSLAFKNKTR